MKQIKELLRRHWSIISYLIFGVLTTAVNYLVYLPLYNGLGLSAALSNSIAWAFSVAFAFLTNKPFVFQSHDWSLPTVIPELTKFLGTRIGSGLIETGLIFMTVDVLNWNGNIMKLVTSVLVVVINYVGSKLLVFNKNGNYTTNKTVVSITPDPEGGYIASVPEMPGCISCGETIGETQKNIDAAQRVWLNAMREMGKNK